MKKTMISFAGLFLAIFTFWASSSPKNAQVSKETFTFDYAVSSQEKLGSAELLIGLINPNYAENFQDGNTDLFQRFQRSIGADVEEMLVAKGFRLKGPYDSQDEMVFSDKKDTDLMLLIEIVPEFTNAQGQWKEQFRLTSSTPKSYKYVGTCSLVGKINLSGVEPLTSEKIWSKSVNIPTVNNIKMDTEYAYKSASVISLDDPAIHNSMGVALQAVYKGILDKMATYINPEELRSLKPQIKELKAKKGY